KMNAGQPGDMSCKKKIHDEYLDHVNGVRYFPEVLGHTVIANGIDPSLIISETIYQHGKKNHEEPIVDAEMQSNQRAENNYHYGPVSLKNISEYILLIQLINQHTRNKYGETSQVSIVKRHVQNMGNNCCRVKRIFSGHTVHDRKISDDDEGQ